MSTDSTPTTMFHRRKQVKQLRDSDIVFPFQKFKKAILIASTSRHSNLGNMSNNSTPAIMYQRKKQIRGSDIVVPFQTSTKANPTSNSLSVISSEAPILPDNKSEVFHTEPAKDYINLPSKITVEQASSRRSLSEELGLVEDSRCDMIRNVDVSLANESCSSSKSNMDLCAASLNCECSSSEVFIKKSMWGVLTEKDIRSIVLRILRTDGGVCSTSTSDSSEFPGSQQCKVCGQSEITPKMLICDQCEEAFHISCCYPRVKKLPIKEWFCYSCSKKKHKMLKEMGKGRFAISKGALGPIAAMLEDTEPYSTSVHIGQEFQAEVPDWSGPLT